MKLEEDERKKLVADFVAANDDFNVACRRLNEAKNHYAAMMAKRHTARRALYPLVADGPVGDVRYVQAGYTSHGGGHLSVRLWQADGEAQAEVLLIERP